MIPAYWIGFACVVENSWGGTITLEAFQGYYPVLSLILFTYISPIG